MIFAKTINVAAGSDISSYESFKVPVHAGTLSHVTVYFIPGSCCLTKIALYYRDRQIYPDSRDEYIYGNDVIYNDSISFEIDNAEDEIIIRAYNEDEKYDHQILVKLTVEEKTENIENKIYQSLNSIESLLDKAINTIKESPLDKIIKAQERKE